MEGANGRIIEVAQDPRVDGDRIGDDQQGGQQVGIAGIRPDLMLRRQRTIGQYSGFLCLEAHGRLGSQQRNANDHDNEHIDDQKQRAAVGAQQIGKAPDGADAHSKPDGGHEKAHQAAECVSSGSFVFRHARNSFLLWEP